MLKELRIKNLKSISDSSLTLSKITVLIGKNGSGKSSILQSLALLKQSLGGSQLNTNGPLVALGRFVDVLRRGLGAEADMHLGVTVTKDFDPPLALQTSPQKPVNWATGMFKVDWHVGLMGDATGQVSAMEVDYATPDRTATIVGSYARAVGGGGAVKPSTIMFNGSAFSVTVDGALGRGLRISGEPGTPANVQEAARNRKVIEEFLQTPAQPIENFFLAPAARGTEVPSYDLGERPSRDFTGAQGSMVQGQTLATTLAYERGLETKISGWLEQVTGRKLRAPIIPSRRVSLEAGYGDTFVNIVNEGFGSNQLSFVLTLLAVLQPQSVLAIEEPEIHLHPAAQVALVNVLLKGTSDSKSQLLMATHSEHVLYALMALVAEGALASSDLAVYHVDREGDATVVRALPIDDKGRVQGGLPGFFDAQVQAFRRHVEAVQKKQ